MKRISLPFCTLFFCLLALGGVVSPLSAQDASGHWDGAIVTPHGNTLAGPFTQGGAQLEFKLTRKDP